MKKTRDFTSLFCNVRDGHFLSIHAEFHLIAAKFQPIDAAGVCLIPRARILCEHADERVALLSREAGQQLRRDTHRQRMHLYLPSEAFCCLRAAVGVGDVGLDIIDRRAVHQVCSGDVEHRPARVRKLDPFQTHA